MMSGRQANNVDSNLCARRYDEWTPVTELREWKDSGRTLQVQVQLLQEKLMQQPAAAPGTAPPDAFSSPRQGQQFATQAAELASRARLIL